MSTDGHGYTEYHLLLATLEISKLSKLKQKYGNNNLNNINPTTCCAQNNTLRAQENIPLSRWGALFPSGNVVNVVFNNPYSVKLLV